ncbi:MAG: Flp pilus assembly complex ATPase component TadA [Alphaproteobacteria bacterium]|nr:Flp pilus assembly complex ATPase component TadA [Alphaproteobacteria bacterium]
MSLLSPKKEEKKEPAAPERPAMRKPELNTPIDALMPRSPAQAPQGQGQGKAPQQGQVPPQGHMPPQGAMRPMPMQGMMGPQGMPMRPMGPGMMGPQGMPMRPQGMMPQPMQNMGRIEMPRQQQGMTKEEHLAKIKAELEEAAKIPDLIPCEHLGLINEVDFSDVYITPDKKCYTWAAKSDAGLKVVTFEDYPEFLQQLEETYDGTNRSYLLTYKGRHFRVERTISGDGPQFCARKMPIKVPQLKKLGLPQGLYNYLLSLSGRSGLILLAGPTGSGKSTTISALLQEYLSEKGGYCFTIEDPIELPLDGVYLTPSGELGLCKQTVPPDGIWQEGIKSALRSKPRYIYLGEIRDPNVASEALRAATSGHLVLSTIHANNVSDSINSLVKYAASSGISEEMAYELVANGFLGCLHQILTGAPKRISVTYVFANPDLSAGCQVRSMFRNGKLNLSTIMEQQKIKMDKGMPLF